MKRLMRERRKLTVFEKHQLRIARDTLKMSDIGAHIMGGMTKKEAKNFINSLLKGKAKPS